jgi:hypothetical protein
VNSGSAQPPVSLTVVIVFGPSNPPERRWEALVSDAYGRGCDTG